ncbi:DUF2461 domain-containing protein [Christensenella intestinihominis]|uniref:DUF2461 domain-containing protein n=1 Tax=Christensenella intestinihominis TaxID=1851429 RepID=UPI000830FCA5|nr:DUF2461 domain-containing protein [Christensenella intestinihominis]
MDTKSILDYLSALAAHNDRDWFHANRRQYDEARSEFEALVQELCSRIAAFDPSACLPPPKNLIFRINRDTRFSKDKSPYNPCFRAHISPGGRSPFPAGYYLSAGPGRVFLGGGVFASVFPEATALVRDRIAERCGEFTAIITAKEFAEHFNVLGEKLKNVPRGYEKENPCAEYLKHKAWDIEYDIPAEVFCDAGRFVNEAAHIFRLMKPFNDFLNEALKGFRMPER